MQSNTIISLGAAAACAGLLSLAMQAHAAEPRPASAPLSKQCGLVLDPQVDEAARPYVDGLVAVGGNGAAWLPGVCAEAGAAKGEEGLQRVKAALGAHLLHQVNAQGTLSAAQRHAVGQAIDRAKERLASKDQALELVYVDVRTNAALAGVPADGFAHQLKERAQAVAKTLDGFAQRWGP